MKKKISALLASIFMLLTTSSIYAISQPSETIIFNLPNNGAANWKEVNRQVTEKQGIVESIPKDQTYQNWSELITIQFFHKSLLADARADNLMDRLLDLTREAALRTYPDSKMTWKIIEKHNDDSIYEEILSTPHKDSLPFHEISRCFLTKTGFHCIGFRHQNAKMSSDEKEKRIELLKEFTSVTSLEEAAHTLAGLSLADRLPNSLDLGIWKNWKITDTQTSEDGRTIITRVPPGYTEANAKEYLVIFTRPNLNCVSKDQAFNIEMKALSQEKLTHSISNKTPKLLKDSDREYIYSYTKPKSKYQLHTVTRTVISDTSHYTISYCHELDRKMTEAELLQCQEKLELIKIPL